MAASVAAGLIVPRLEHAYLPGAGHEMAVGSALAFFSAVSSGMIALTGIGFAIAFVFVQLGATAYSPRLVAVFASSPRLFHTLGLFFATFLYSLAALIWTDRNGSGAVPLLSTYLVGTLLVASMLAFAELIDSLRTLQVQNVLEQIGDRGRTEIGAVFPESADDAGREGEADSAPELGWPDQTVFHIGPPRTVAGSDLAALIRLAEEADAVVALRCGVGDSVVERGVLMRVHGARSPPPESALRRAIRLAPARTLDGDPKFALRLLVDIAIRALSPAVNDPTTAVQALDQIEDLMVRLGRRRLEARQLRGPAGAIRVVALASTWEDFLALAFDEIRQFGAASVQVDRRLRAALTGLIEALPLEARRAAVRRYLDHLEQGVGRSQLDDQDRETARREDRQGLGLTR
jgi:uncharacterized membrane protein